MEWVVKVYREYYDEKGMYENALYPGIDRLLHSLRQRGKILAVATSKPTVFSVKILEHFQISQYFAFVSGAELDEQRADKVHVIKHALDYIETLSPDQAIMIGDTKYDILGARALGMESIGVLYGYGSLEELTAAGADYIVRDMQELSALLQG
jgi:phosphoglycolate phosphatase